MEERDILKFTIIIILLTICYLFGKVIYYTKYKKERIINFFMDRTFEEFNLLLNKTIRLYSVFMILILLVIMLTIFL